MFLYLRKLFFPDILSGDGKISSLGKVAFKDDLYRRLLHSPETERANVHGTRHLCRLSECCWNPSPLWHRHRQSLATLVMGHEQQLEEREVLSSIFPDEISDISASEYRISIALDLPAETEDDPPAPTLLLHVSYPDTYPDTPPRLDINAPANAARHPQFDVQQDKETLLRGLDATIDENLGMAMVFALVTTLKESAEQLVLDRRAAQQTIRDKEAAKAEAEENRKFEGTKVTRETFLKWREGFRKEMDEEKERLERAKEEELKRRKVKEEKKLSGKELWVRGLVGTVEEEEVEEDEVVEGIREVKVK